MLADRRNTPIRPAVHGSECSIGKLYRSSLDDPAELVELNSLLYEEGKDAGAVWREFESVQAGVARSTINKHRGKSCRCFTIDKDVCCEGCRYDFDHCICDAA